MSLAFTLEKYVDEVMCDVVPMEATHILLSKSWQFDRKVTHDGDSNRFYFVHLGEKVVLKHLSPREIYEDQINMRIKREEKRKEKEKAKKAKEKKKREKKKEKSKTNIEKKKEVRGKL
ncbi:hypothetical protein CR513_05329, partial [Mucuna pruriens]